MDPREILEANLDVIDGSVAAACRRARRYGPDAEDFAASVHLAFIENDYAVLRRYQGRSAFSTYLTVVIERLMDDDRNRTMGRWRPSAEAMRLGPAALLLESLVRRDGRSLEEALPFVETVDPSLTREQIQTMLEQIPARSARARITHLDDVASELCPKRPIRWRSRTRPGRCRCARIKSCGTRWPLFRRRIARCFSFDSRSR
ncbi:MAG TPA: hypothetical protein VN380_08040 [Thermoanaerobaculia bacterium]|jgi:hypothetical protein|nr:hypothetical protein [Thermoanaerobaculia bacterium]